MENLLYGLFYEKNGRQLYKICSPVNGRVVDQSEVDDEIISCGVLGQSFAVLPSDGHFLSPFNGTVTEISPFGEKISLKSDDGLEILIRIGDGTGRLKRNGISTVVERGDRVIRNKTIANVDLELLRLGGVSTLSSVTLTNSDEYSQFTVFEGECLAGVSEIMMFTRSRQAEISFKKYKKEH